MDIRKHECPICFKKFIRAEHKQRHVNIHKGLKPYQCTTCMKCFGRKDELMRHERIHVYRSDIAIILEDSSNLAKRKLPLPKFTSLVINH